MPAHRQVQARPLRWKTTKIKKKNLFAACSRLDGVLFLLIRQISQAVGGRSSDCQATQWG